jgi:hypothetical protein
MTPPDHAGIAAELTALHDRVALLNERYQAMDDGTLDPETLDEYGFTYSLEAGADLDTLIEELMPVLSRSQASTGQFLLGTMNTAADHHRQAVTMALDTLLPLLAAGHEHLAAHPEALAPDRETCILGCMTMLVVLIADGRSDPDEAAALVVTMTGSALALLLRSSPFTGRKPDLDDEAG